MGEAYIMRRGGMSKLFSVIGVTYPEGSVCTCTSGDRTLRARGTGGKWIFPVPFAGEWVVSCTSGSNSKSQTVNITAEGQTETVNLSYQLVLFDNGSYAPQTGGWSDIVGGKLSKTHGANFNMSGSNTWACITNQAVSLNGYTKLKFIVDSFSPAWYPVCNFGVGPSKNNQAASLTISSTGEKELDISSVTGDSYVLMLIGGASRYNETADGMTSCSISKVWLERGET